MLFLITLVNALLISQTLSLPKNDSSLQKRQLGATGGDGIFNNNCDLTQFGSNNDHKLYYDCALGAAYYCRAFQSCDKNWKSVYGKTKYLDIYDACAKYGPSYNEERCISVSAKHCGMVGSPENPLDQQMRNCEAKVQANFKRSDSLAFNNPCIVACTSYKIVLSGQCPYGFSLPDPNYVCKV